MSYAEDMGYDAYDFTDIPEHTNNESHWKEGIHFDRQDNKYLITEMTDSHLLATIKYFENADTSPLKEEARRRGLPD